MLNLRHSAIVLPFLLLFMLTEHRFDSGAALTLTVRISDSDVEKSVLSLPPEATSTDIKPSTIIQDCRLGIVGSVGNDLERGLAFHVVYHRFEESTFHIAYGIVTCIDKSSSVAI